MEVILTVFIIIPVFLYTLVYLFARPRWPAHRHFPALKRHLLTHHSSRALLETDTSNDSSTQEPDPPRYSVAFDHINNLGFLTYVMHITLHDLHIFPRDVTCDDFDIMPPDQSNQAAGMVRSDVIMLGTRVAVARQHIIRSLFVQEHAEWLIQTAKRRRLKPRLREFKHDPTEQNITLTFHFRPSHLKLKSGNSPATHQTHVEAFLTQLLEHCLDLRPKHDTPGAQWVDLFNMISHRAFDDRRKVLTHILKNHDREPAVSKLCKAILESDHYVEKFVLMRHDPDRFFEAISPEHLQVFVQRYTNDSEGVEHDINAISPERFPALFGAHLPRSILHDRKIPTPYRIELTRAWLGDPRIPREELHEAIAQMSKSDQLQLRAALEEDGGMSGALSSIEDQAGKLTLDHSQH